MSDFLSPAINERLEEKRMEFSEKLLHLYQLAWLDGMDRRKGEKEWIDKVNALFLDTIEKAKPDERKDIDPTYDRGFNDCAWLFERSLKKEIGK